MQLRGKPAASIVYFGNLCTNNLFKCAYNVLSPRTATAWVKKRNERGGKKPFKCYVTTKRGGGTNRTKKKATTGTNAARRKSSSAFSVLQKSVVSTQGPVRSVETFFFFLLFHPLSFSFSYKILQSGMRENNNSVSFTTGYVNTFQNQLLLKPSNKYKRKKKTFFPIPQGPGTSQRLSLHKHAQCFRTPLTGGNKRCGVVEISQPSTGEKKRSLKERHLLQHAFMRGFAC